MSDGSGGYTTGGSIGGGMHIETTHLGGSLSGALDNMQKSKNLGSFVESSPVGAISRLGNALKGMKDVVAMPTLSISPPVIPLGAGAKIPGIMSRKG
ncbi:MAG: hypothetical protein AB8B46_04245 [Candidatus Midichloriaceae bacterium]